MANPASYFSEKSQLRRSVKRRLIELSPLDRERRSRIICANLAIGLADKTNIGLFAPKETEPNLDLLWEMGFVKNRLIAYPRCEGDELQFFSIPEIRDLRIGKFGIREPAAIRRVCQLDAIVLPGLAFTQDGIRLGHGTGFYDRFLQTQHGKLLKVGVCFDFQIVPAIPQEIHDVNVDLLVFA